MKRHILSFILIFSALICFFAMPARVYADVELNASRAVLLDVDSGQILYGKNPYTLVPTGDFDKLLTIITALQFENPPKNLTVTGEAVYTNYATPLLGLEKGQTVNFTDMLFAMYLGGYNDAANVVAENLGQTLIDTTTNEYAAMSNKKKTAAAIDAYVSQMNKVAHELYATTFKSTNADGHLYDTQQCSCLDVARLVSNGLRNKDFAKLLATTEYSIPLDATKVNNRPTDYKDKLTKLHDGVEVSNLAALSSNEIEFTPADGSVRKINLKSTNKLLDGSILYSGILGACSAYNRSAELYHCMAIAENNGRRLIAVVMNGDENLVYEDVQNLLNFGFYKWDTATVSEHDIEKVLPDNISSRDLAYNGKTDILLPVDYSISDLDTAVSYTENDYLSGTVTFTLPKEASYAGTITEISFYEKNEHSIWMTLLNIFIVLIILIVLIFVIRILIRYFGSKGDKLRSANRRAKKTAKKEKAKQYGENGYPKRKKEKSENRKNYEKIKQRKEREKGNNRRNRS